MRKKVLIFILMLFCFTKNTYAIIKANNFILDTKVDHDYVIGYLGHRAYDCPYGFAVVKLNPDVKAPETGVNDSTIYLVDTTVNRILYSRSDTKYKTYGSKGGGAGQFEQPYGVEATKEGRIYITEYGNHRVSILQNNKGVISFIKTFGGYGDEKGQFKNPRYCALDSSGNIYIVDTGNSKIQKFNSNGNPIYSFVHGMDNGICTPRYPYGITIGKDDYIYVSTITGRIIKYSSTGEVEKFLRLEEIGIENSKLYSLEHDYYGNIYAVDKENCQIHVFDKDLNYIYTFGEKGSGKNQFDDPRDIAIWRDYGTAMITEKTGVQIYYIGTEILSAKCEPVVFSAKSSDEKLKKTEISYSITISSRVTISIKNSSGNEVKRICTDEFQDIGLNEAEWDGKDYNGKDVPEGNYTIMIKAIANYGAGNTDIENLTVTVKSPPKINLNSIDPQVIDPSHSEVVLNYNINEDSEVYIGIAEKDGTNYNTIITLEDGVLKSAGDHSISWDGKVDGSIVEDNIYYFVIEAENDFGIRSEKKYAEIAVNFVPLKLKNISVNFQRFNPKNSNFSPAVVSYELSESANITAKVYNSDTIFDETTFVCTLASNEQKSKGEHSLQWNGKTSDGNYVLDGIYTIRLEANQPIMGDAQAGIISTEVDTTPPNINLVKGSGFNPYISPNEDSSIGIKDKTQIDYSMNENGHIKVGVYNNMGQLVKSLFDSDVLANAMYQTMWDGKDSTNGFVPDGHYYFRIDADDGIGNNSFKIKKVIVDNNKLEESGGIQVANVINLTADGSGNYKPELSPDGLEIVYVSYRNYNFNIWVMNMDGSEKKQLTFEPADGTFPKWSPDGSKIAYASDAYSLWVMNSDGSDKKRLTDYYWLMYEDHNWSPDGSQIVYTSINSGIGGIWVINTDGSGKKLLASGYPYNYNPQWSPDGAKILYQSYQSDYDIWIMNADGSGKKQLTIDARIYLDRPQWSPNGAKITFSSYDNRLWIMNADGSDQKQIAYGGGSRWSLDNSKIAFVSANNIWIMNADGSDQKQLVYGGGPRWTLDGSKIIFVSNGVIKLLTLNNLPKLNLTANISKPKPFSVIKNNIDIIGTVNDSYFDYYKLEYGIGSLPSSWNTIISNKHNITDDILGVFNTTVLNNGEYTLRLKAKDLAGNVREKEILVNIQNLDTDIIQGFYSSEYFISQNNPTVISYNLKVGASVKLTVNNSSGVVKTFVDSFQNPGVYQYSWDGTDVPDGEYTYKIYINYNSRIVEQSSTLVVDNTVPVLSIHQPTNNSILSGDFINITGSVEDDNFTDYILEYASGIIPDENDYISFYKFNQEVTNGLLGNLNISDLNGFYTIRLKSIDKAKNTSINTIVLNIDHIIPVAEIIEPAENDVFSQTISVKGTALDNNFYNYSLYYGEGVNPAEWQEITNSNIPVTNDFLIQNWDCSFLTGLYIIKLTVKDQVGYEKSDTVQVIFDKTPPLTTVMPSVPLFNNGNQFANKECRFILQSEPVDSYSAVDYIEYSRDDGDFIIYTNSICFTNEGEHNIKYKAVDNLGNWEELKSFSVIIDNSFPECLIKVYQPKFVTNTKIYVPVYNDVSFDVEDKGLIPSGVKFVSYSIDEGNSWKTYAGEGIMLTRPGTNKVMHYVIDNVDNSSTIFTQRIILDPASPWLNMTIEGISYTNQSIIYLTSNHRFQLSANESYDFDSGLAFLEYKINEEDWLDYNLPVKINYQAINTFSYRALDKVGNEIKYEETICIDNDPPEINLYSSGDLFNNLYAPSFYYYYIECNDEFSGIKDILINIDNSGYKEYTNQITFQTEGTHIIKYKAVDNLNNVSEEKEYITIVDSSPPISSLIPSEPMIYYQNHYYASLDTIYSINTVDNFSGVNGVFINIDNKGWGNYSVPFSFITEGTHTVHFYSVDNVGNIESTNEYEIITPLPDIIPPITICDYTNSGEWVNYDVHIKLTAEDPTIDGFASGVDYTMFMIVNYNEPPDLTSDIYNLTSIVKGQGLVLPPITDEGIHRVCFWSLDKVGNKEDVSTNYSSVISNSQITGLMHRHRRWNQTPTTNVVWILLDKTFPEITVAGIADNQAYTQNMTVDISASDRHLYRIEVEILRFQGIMGVKQGEGEIVYNVDWTNDDLLKIKNLRFKITNDGVYEIKVSASDLAGNITLQEIEFVIDKNAPDTPQGLSGYVEYATNVALFWNEVTNNDLAGYNVYRNRGLIQDYKSQITNYYYDTGLTNGLYEYHISSVDWLGNESELSETLILVVDKSVIILLPESGVYYRKIAKIKAKINTDVRRSKLIIDYGLGTNPVEWKTIKEFKHWSKYIHTLWYPWILKEKINGKWKYLNGEFRLRVRLINENGMRQDSRIVWIDNKAPKTEIAEVIKVTNKKKCCDKKVINFLQGNELKVIAYDPVVETPQSPNDIYGVASGIDYTYVKIYKYGEGIIVKEKNYEQRTNKYELTDGFYKIYYYSEDNAKWHILWQGKRGNREKKNKDYVLVDTVSPVVSIDLPVSGQVVSGEVLIKGQITDICLSGYEIYYTNEYYGKVILKNEVLDIKYKNYKLQTINYELIRDTAGLYDTDYKIVVRATDFCGNSQQAEVDVILTGGGGPAPNRSPDVPENLLVDGKINPVINHLTPNISWEFRDLDENDHQTAYQIQGLKDYRIKGLEDYGEIIFDTGKVLSTNKNCTINLTQYNYQKLTANYKIRVWDKGNLASYWTDGEDYFVIDINITDPDMESPVIVLEGVPSITNESVVLQYTVTDNRTAHENIIIHGDNSPYETEGEHHVTLKAIDEAGNFSLTNIQFIIDMTTPEIIITGVQEDQYYNNSVTVSVEIIDENLRESNIVIRHNENIIHSTSESQLTEEIKEEGNYRIEAQGEDKAGNVANRVLEFGIDLTAPIVNIEGVEEGGEYTEVNPVITAIDTNLSKLDIYLNENVILFSNTKLPTMNYELQTIKEDGDYKLKAKAEDKASNIAEKEVNFHIIPFSLSNALLFYANYNENTADAAMSRGNGTCIRGGALTRQGEGFKGIYKALDSSKCKGSTKGAEHSSTSNINLSRGSVLMWVKTKWKSANNSGRCFFAVRKPDDSGNENDYVMSYGVIKNKGTVVYIRDDEGYVEQYQADDGAESTRWYKEEGWHYIGYSWDSNRGIVNFYIDGKIIKSYTNTGWSKAESGNMWIGNFKYKSCKYAKSRIDEFVIYSRSLTSEEIKDQYDEQRTLYVDANYNGEEEGTREKPYNTINEALSKSDHRMIIKVKAGEYIEKLYIKKSITIEGEEGAVVTYNKCSDYLIKASSCAEKVKISGLKIDGNNKINYVVKIENENCTISNCHVMSGKKKNIYIGGCKTEGKIRLIRNVIEKCEEKGIYVGNKSEVEIINNTIVKNGLNKGSSCSLGIYINHKGNRKVTIMNNIIYDNGKYGIKKIKGNVEIKFNDVYNHQYDYYNCSAGQGDISVNPEFVDETDGDYHLKDTSPCIDAGNPAPQYNDPDGSRNDIGCYYYTNK